MRKNIQNVLTAFIAGVSRREATCDTDGTYIRSYATRIAKRLPDGSVWVDSNRGSATTNSQITAILHALGDTVRVIRAPVEPENKPTSFVYATEEIKATASYQAAVKAEEAYVTKHGRVFSHDVIAWQDNEVLADAWETAGFHGWADNYRAANKTAKAV